MATYTYRLRIRNAADSADALTVTSVVGGTNPYISEPPSGDGQGFNPRTGETQVGAYTVRIADNGSAANAITGFLADANSRYDKLGRRAYLEYGTDGTTFPNLLVAGYVTGISYPSAAEAMVSVGEAQRAERTKQAFTVATTTFPPTTMLGGGPVRWPSGVNVLPVNWPNRGPWTMKRNDTGGATGAVTLIFVSGYVLKDADAVTYTLATNGAMPAYTAQRINTLVSTEVPGAAAGPTAGIYRVGNVYADVYAAGVLQGTFQCLAERPDLTLGNSVFLTLEWTSAAAAGTEYQVYLYTKTISENNPLHLLMHPVDIVTGLIDDAGELWDTTTAATVKASIGADVRVFLRVTRSESTDTAIARIMGLFGFGRRMNSANKWEFFDQRTKTTSAPAVTIAYDDLRELPPKVWDLNDSTILNTITVTTERFAIWAPGQSSTRPPDSLVPVEQKRTARFQLADGTFPDTSQGVKELTYAIQGTILNASGSETNLTDFTNALAAPAFDRWGYGAPSSGLICRATVGAGANIGDEVLLNLGYLPNVNTRGGQRIVQIVQRTNEPGGPVLQVEDAGASAQPAVAPTFTIIASPTNVYAKADVALTNAAALVTAGVVSVVVEWQVSVLSPVIAGQDLGSILPVAPVTLTTPQVAAGSKVWARCKSVQPGKRSGTFTSWAGVTLTAVGAPSAVSFNADPITPTDGSKGYLAWTAGSNSAGYNVRVLLRLSSLGASSNVIVADLLPGSTLCSLSGLTPAAGYTATIQYVDPATGIVAAQTTPGFSAVGTSTTLSAPFDPWGIVGSTDSLGVMHVDGTYGLDVSAIHIPGVIEFYVETETGVASNLYGTPVLGASLPAISGGPTEYRVVAAHDGLRRRLSARHVATGMTSSAYTSPVVLDPWGAIIGPRIAAEILNVTRTDGPTTSTIFFLPSSSVDSVWVGTALVTAPENTADWAVAAAATPLAAGVFTFTVTRPLDGHVLLIQIEPRYHDMAVGIVKRITMTATSQLPAIELDDTQSTFLATQWFKITERGIAVSSVEVQTQIGVGTVSAWGAPTRSAGGASTVRGGTLGSGEYEHDVALSIAGGLPQPAAIMPRLNLANGVVKVLGPFDFNGDPFTFLTASAVLASYAANTITVSWTDNGRSVLLDRVQLWGDDGNGGAFSLLAQSAAYPAALSPITFTSAHNLDAAGAPRTFSFYLQNANTFGFFNSGNPTGVFSVSILSL
jgi:hypothetical protein